MASSLNETDERKHPGIGPKKKTASMEQIDYQFPGISIRVLSAIPDFTLRLLDIYPQCSDIPFEKPGMTFRLLQLIQSHRGKTFIVEKNDKLAFVTSTRHLLLPQLSSMINQSVWENQSDFVMFHSAAVSYHDFGIMLPAESQSGKSTLTLSLLMKGCGYLSDEISILNRQSFSLLPFAKSLSLREAIFHLFPQFTDYLYAQLSDNQWNGDQDNAYLSPHILGKNSFSQPCPLRLIVFPRFMAGYVTRIEPLARGAAVLQLLNCCFNLAQEPELGIDFLLSAVRQADCYVLEYGDVYDATERILCLIHSRKQLL